MNTISIVRLHGPANGVLAQGSPGNNTESIGRFWTTVAETFQESFFQIAAMADNVLAMAVILVVGFLAAKLLQKVTTALAHRLGLQRASDRSGLTESMRQVGIGRTVPAIIGLIVFWLLMSVAVMAAFKVLGLPAVSEAMRDVVAYIPKLLMAIVVVVIGLLVASFFRGVVATSADRIGVTYAEYLANGCYYILTLITFLAAAGHLGLQLELLEKLILMAFGALAVGLGLALGLGGREVVAGILAGYYVRQRFTAGDHVSVGGVEGTVREVGPMATVVETEEEGLMHRRSVPNSLMLKEAVR